MIIVMINTPHYTIIVYESGTTNICVHLHHQLPLAGEVGHQPHQLTVILGDHQCISTSVGIDQELLELDVERSPRSNKLSTRADIRKLTSFTYIQIVPTEHSDIQVTQGVKFGRDSKLTKRNILTV